MPTYIEYLEFELLMFISNSCLALALTLPRYLKQKNKTIDYEKPILEKQLYNLGLQQNQA